MLEARPYSTKLPRPVPVEFEAAFVEGGWQKVNAMFGKRASLRWVTVSGRERLQAMRKARRS